MTKEAPMKIVGKAPDSPELITRELPYLLTPQELNNLGLEMANNVAELSDLEKHKASFMVEHKKGADEAKGQIKLLATKIRSGIETRLIECRVQKDYLAGKVLIYRNDTDELVEERVMTTEERQKYLFEQSELQGPRQIDLS